MERLIVATRLGGTLKSQRHIKEAVSVAGSLLGCGSPVLPLVGPCRLPSRQTLQRARARLDVSAILFNHWHFAQEKRLSFRYIAYDASPQEGTELFASVERLIFVQADGEATLVQERRLPLVTLGHGRYSLPDKLQAHVHQTWLELGPTPANMTACQRRCQAVPLRPRYGVCYR